MKLEPLVEERLLLAALEGDRSAFSDLCQQYSSRLMRTVQRITRNREDAEDALQNAFMNAFVHLGNFDCRAQFSTWLTRIAVNSALMILRKRRRHLPEAVVCRDTEEDKSFFWEPADTAPGPEHSVLKAERTALLKSAVLTLRPHLRVALEVWATEGGSPTEGARQLNISIPAFKSRVTRAKAALSRACRTS